MPNQPKILITCGELSGDMHGAKLVEQLLVRMPHAQILAFGGDRVAAAGATLVRHMEDYAVIGFSGVLANLPRFFALERCLKGVLDNGVDLLIAVDYPGLNLRLAAHAKKRGIPVLYYISPQVWAWGADRVEKMASTVDFMTVILPFEASIYEGKGVPVEFVGHPFVEDHELPQARPQNERAGVGLLPGSRAQEVHRVLPVLLDTAREIRATRPDERFTIGLSPNVPSEVYKKMIDRHGVDVTLSDDTREVMMGSRLVLVASGTATLQSALFETPLLIVYRVSLLNYLIARRVIKIDNIGLVNVVLGQRVCPEFVQQDARSEEISRAAVQLLEDARARDAMVSRFRVLREMLGGKGGCARVAEIAEQLMGAR